MIPGFGLFGVLGAAGVAGGLYMSLLGGLPTAPDFTRAGMILTTTVLVLLVTAWAILRALPGNARLSRSGIFLSDRTDRSIGYTSAARRSDLVGLTGRAVTDLRPSGTAVFGEERVDVVTDSEWISAGTAIEVISAEGYRHVVRPLHTIANDRRSDDAPGDRARSSGDPVRSAGDGDSEAVHPDSRLDPDDGVTDGGVRPDGDVGPDDDVPPSRG